MKPLYRSKEQEAQPVLSAILSMYLVILLAGVEVDRDGALGSADGRSKRTAVAVGRHIARSRRAAPVTHVSESPLSRSH